MKPRIAQVVVGQGWDLLELRPLGMSLEEIFLKLTTEDVAADGQEPAETAAASPARSRR